MKEEISYRDWHVPYLRDGLSLADALQDMSRVGAREEDIPLMVQLVENPKFRIPGITLFHGAVGLELHDAIHIILGRGLLPMDEAFTIGFTMGSTGLVSTVEEKLYSLLAQYVYPSAYQFSDDDIAVFSNAVRLGHISACQPLDSFDFSPYRERPLHELRQLIGLESELILAWYRIEQQRYPASPASQRLLDH